MNVRLPIADNVFATGQPSLKLALGLAMACQTLFATDTNSTPTPRTTPKGYTLNCWQTDEGLPQMTPTAITQTALDDRAELPRDH
jgi:hypothetical protein